MRSTLEETDETRRAELGRFIRSHRERTTPEALGLDPGRRRRTPGLRREEIAQLAGVSATWLSWIEQGRDISVSAAALARLARILRLSAAERAYLFDLAGRLDPDAVEPPATVVPPGLAAIADAIISPAYVLDRAWNVPAANAPARHLFGWPEGVAPNLLRFVFLDPAAPALIADWETRALRLAAEFRADYSRHLAAPETRALVEALRSKSPFFAHAWEAHAVTDREGGERTFNHPTDGFLRFTQTTFLLAPHPEVKLVVLIAA